MATVGIYTFPAGTELTPEGANRYVAPAGVTPVLAKDASVHQGAIEAANQDVVQGSLESDHDAAPGGDDAAGADRLPHRVQQVCHARICRESSSGRA